MKKPILLRPDGGAAGLRADQQECIRLLEGLLDNARNGDIWSCVVVAYGPNDFGSAMAGTDAPHMILGLEVAKADIMARVTGKKSVIHR